MSKATHRAASLRPGVVDVHAHALCPAVEKLVADRPGRLAEFETFARGQGEASMRHNAAVMLPDAGPKMIVLERRLAALDAAGVAVQLVSPSPSQYHYWAEPTLADEIVGLVNEGVASLCAQCPDRLVGLCSVAMQHPDRAAAQLRAAMAAGLLGVEISTSVGDSELDDRRFDAMWAAAEETGALVFLHPFGSSLGTRIDRYYLANILGQPVETTIALSQLIFGGVLDRHPRLRLLAAHGGGYLPFYPGRSEHGRRVRPEAGGPAHPVSHYLRRIAFDTVLFDPALVAMLIDRVGSSQVMFGSDFPFDMGDLSISDSVGELTGETREAVLGGNARRLLGLADAEVPS